MFSIVFVFVWRFSISHCVNFSFNISVFILRDYTDRLSTKQKQYASQKPERFFFLILEEIINKSVFDSFILFSFSSGLCLMKRNLFEFLLLIFTISCFLTSFSHKDRGSDPCRPVWFFLNQKPAFDFSINNCKHYVVFFYVFNYHVCILF